eukprot:scaffold84186_cov16-Tisochrysis_lutea.AAC.1
MSPSLALSFEQCYQQHIHLVYALAQVANVSTGADWKGALARSDDASQQPPAFVSRIMANNFRTVQGSYVIVGLMGLPLWAWGFKFLPSDNILRHPALGAVLLPGRVMAAVVELWVLSKHLGSLLRQDAAAAAVRSRSPSSSRRLLFVKAVAPNLNKGHLGSVNYGTPVLKVE